MAFPHFFFVILKNLGDGHNMTAVIIMLLNVYYLELIFTCIRLLNASVCYRNQRLTTINLQGETKFSPDTNRTRRIALFRARWGHGLLINPFNPQLIPNYRPIRLRERRTVHPYSCLPLQRIQVIQLSAVYMHGD